MAGSYTRYDTKTEWTCVAEVVDNKTVIPWADKAELTTCTSNGDPFTELTSKPFKNTKLAVNLALPCLYGINAAIDLPVPHPDNEAVSIW